MHYRRSAFSSPSGSTTIVVTNHAEYNRQGQPTLGSTGKTQLSSGDATQLNRMYNCPGSGMVGILEIYLKTGFGVPGSSSYPDRYVRVTAVDDIGQNVVHIPLDTSEEMKAHVGTSGLTLV